MIRDAVSGDLPRLSAIQAASLASPWPELLETALSTPELELDGLCCFVITPPEDNTPVGYVLSVEGAPETDDQTTSGKQCYLAEIAVSPDHRRNGYGTALLDAVSEHTDADELLLTARADDATARAFYTEHDFRLVDRLPEYYDDNGPRDGLLLSKSTAPQ